MNKAKHKIKNEQKQPLDFTNTEYDLTGPSGNVFAVMGRVEKLLEDFRLDADIPRYLQEVTAGDYKNAILVSDRYVQFAWVFPDGEEWEEFEQQLFDARDA